MHYPRKRHLGCLQPAHYTAREVDDKQSSVVVSYWTVVFVLSSLLLVGGLYFSFRISVEVRFARRIDEVRFEELKFKSRLGQAEKKVLFPVLEWVKAARGRRKI